MSAATTNSGSLIPNSVGAVARCDTPGATAPALEFE